MNTPEIVIDVLIDDCYSVKSGDNGANMVTFHGSLDCDAFHGKIMPGAVDTQRMRDGSFSLSARYMIKGTDRSGREASVFIENNGSVTPGEPMTTTPTILTDCEELKYLESAELYGTIEPLEKDHIHICIFKK